VGCSACSNGSDGDGDIDGGVDADHDLVDADDERPDTDDAEVDADDADPDIEVTDSDVSNPFDSDCSSEVDGDAVLMDIVDVTTSREGRECGRGCRQVTFKDPVMLWFHYAISGRFLVYRSDIDNPGSILLVDLIRNKEYELDGNPEYRRSPPDIDDGLVSYVISSSDPTNMEKILWRYRIGDCVRHPVVTRTMTARDRPMHALSLSGDTVAWYDSAILAAGIYAMNIYGGEVITVSPQHCVCLGHPILVGRTVIYEGFHTPSRELWMVDIDTLEQINLTNSPAPQFEHDFDGTWTAWTDGRNDGGHGDPYSARYNPDIYGMQIPDGEHEALCTDPSTQLHPAVGEGLVAWEDFRNAENPNGAWDRDADIDIYLLDLGTRREVQVTNLHGQERYPRIDSGRLFYVSEDLEGEPAVFMVDLEEAGII
jgi:hypothetical protein